MKKTIFILLAANLILMGCTSRKIDISEIDKNIPTNYELFNFYYENLDSDSEKEIIVLLQQKRSYVTNDEEFKSLPVIIKVLDSNNGLWIASQDRMIKKKIRYFSNYFPTKETGAPYRIFKNWIILKSQNRSFHGAADTVDIFSYDNDLGLFLIRFGTDGSADYALTSLIDKKDKIYLISCNSFDDSSAKMSVEVIDLNEQHPSTKKMDLDVTCKSLEEYIGHSGHVEPREMEKFLNKKGVFID